MFDPLYRLALRIPLVGTRLQKHESDKMHLLYLHLLYLHLLYLHLLYLHLVYSRLTDNSDFHRDFWDVYATEWMREMVVSEDRSGTTKIVHVGDEWGSAKAVDDIVQQFIYPYVNKDTIAAEIGSGGGRVASRVASQVATLVCLDISAEMLKKLKTALSAHKNIEYVHLPLSGLEGPPQHYDFIYAFDVFVHLDLHTVWRYFKQIKSALKPGGRAFVHTASLSTPDGWSKFAAQAKYNPIDFYFMTPDLVRLLAQQAGFSIIKESSPDPDNFYLNRDFLMVVENSSQPSDSEQRAAGAVASSHAVAGLTSSSHNV